MQADEFFHSFAREVEQYRYFIYVDENIYDYYEDFKVLRITLQTEQLYGEKGFEMQNFAEMLP